jgi:catalase
VLEQGLCRSGRTRPARVEFGCSASLPNRFKTTDNSRLSKRFPELRNKTPGNLFRNMTLQQKQLLLDNTARAISGASQEVLERDVANCRRANPRTAMVWHEH